MPEEDATPPALPRVEQVGEKIGAVAIVVGVLFGISYMLNESRPLDFAYMGERFPILLDAVQVSLFVTVLAYLCGMAIGFFMGWLRTSKRRALRGVASIWVEAIRGTPLFVQIFFLFYVIGYFAPRLDNRALLTGILALMLNTSGYQTEVFRGGLQSVAAGQVEAAKGIGLSYWRSMQHVIFPQALRLVVPPLTNEFIALLKSSSLLFFIGVQELTYRGRILSFGGNLLEVYTMVFAIYLMITVPLGKVVNLLERRYRIPGLGLQKETRVAPRRPVDRSSLTTRLLFGDAGARRRLGAFVQRARIVPDAPPAEPSA